MKAIFRALALLVASTCAWVPNAHHLYNTRTLADDDATVARLVLPFVENRDLADGPQAMRIDNPEWDLMGRMYLVLALANRTIDDKEHEETQRDAAGIRTRDAAAMNAIIADTEDEEARHGQGVFLLPYARARNWVWSAKRSLFVDGEILMMQSARDVALGKAPENSAKMRAKYIEQAMRASPSLSGESYPDEAWTFCNTTALAALAVYDVTSGEDHRDLSRAWIAYAKAHLMEQDSGLLVSSYSREGKIYQGAEGSTIFMTAQNMRFFDDPFAREQYGRARKLLVHDLYGFAYAEEWPRREGSENKEDIDSGPTVPLFHASAGASGLAILGAHAFGDEEASAGFERSLAFVAFPDRGADGNITSYAAGNRLGDAIVVYARAFGPLLDLVTRAKGHQS